MEDQLSVDDRGQLLKLAREALQLAVNGRAILPVDLKSLSPKLQQPGATFVTLTIQGMLRGCIGALEPYLPLAEDVRQHAVAAALEDYRFPPVRPEELDKIEIEISRLTKPTPLNYSDETDLIARLRPRVDGVIIMDGSHRATFLPQVWEKLPDPTEFLNHLCMKMGAPGDLWRHKKLKVQIYQVEEFHEASNPA